MNEFKEAVDKILELDERFPDINDHEYFKLRCDAKSLVKIIREQKEENERLKRLIIDGSTGANIRSQDLKHSQEQNKTLLDELEKARDALIKCQTNYESVIALNGAAHEMKIFNTPSDDIAHESIIKQAIKSINKLIGEN